MQPDGNRWNRRDLLRFGIGGLTTGLLGEGLIGGVSADTLHPTANARSVIYIFLSGGLSQLDSFDLKPDAPADIRGEFRPIATRTPGIHICEHLPLLAQRSDRWSLVRSLSHREDNHLVATHHVLTGHQQPGAFFDKIASRDDFPNYAGGLSYFASGDPDGLTKVSEDHGFASAGKSHDGLLSYGGWSGVVGTLAVLAVIGALVLLLRRRHSSDEG